MSDWSETYLKRISYALNAGITKTPNLNLDRAAHAALEDSRNMNTPDAQTAEAIRALTYAVLAVADRLTIKEED